MVRSMIAVETGSSMGAAARPKAPPTAPDAEAITRFAARPPRNRVSRRLDKAMSSGRVSALSAAFAMILFAGPGKARAINSSGQPASAVILPVNPGFSSHAMAAVSASRSPPVKSMRA
jgi:hypothetical protein